MDGQLANIELSTSPSHLGPETLMAIGAVRTITTSTLSFHLSWEGQRIPKHLLKILESTKIKEFAKHIPWLKHHQRRLSQKKQFWSLARESTFPNSSQKFNWPHASLFVLVYGGEHLRSQCDTADSPRFMEFLQVPLPPPAVQQLLLMRASWLPKSPIMPASLLGCSLPGGFLFYFFHPKEKSKLVSRFFRKRKY